MVNLYRRGRIAERKVANYLKVKKFQSIKRSKGSRGPADIYAKKRGVKYFIQVKYGAASATRKEIKRLRALAKRREGVAAVIQRSKEGKIRWKFLGRWK